MKTTLWAAICVVAAFPLSAVADEWPAERAFEASPVLIQMGADGRVIFDATEGKVLLEVPTFARQFADFDSFAAFLRRYLGAEGTDSVSFTAEIRGEPCGLGSVKGSCVPYEDPVLAYIGGGTGSVIIGGQSYCIDAANCLLLEGDRAGSVPLLTKQFEITGQSWIDSRRMLPDGTAIGRFGSKTEQALGGLHQQWLWGRSCQEWGVGSPCVIETGYNALSTSVSFYSGMSALALWDFREGLCKNCVSHTITKYVIDDPRVYRPDVVIKKAVVGRHWGMGPEGEDSVTSSAGVGVLTE